jgi:hypothetical protein
MQAANAVICATVPATENAAPIFAPALPLLGSTPETPAVALEFVTLVVALDAVVVPSLATAGAPDPPHPVSVLPRAPRIAASASLLTPKGNQQLLKQP